MGNCALKPKVLTSGGAPAPEELETSRLEDQKVDAAKSLSNLFLQANAEKKTKEEEKTTPEKIPVTEDLKTSLSEAKSPTKEIKSPATTETKPPATTETKYPVTEKNVPADDQKVRNEETVRDEQVNDDATVKETETEAKPDEVISEVASTMKEI